MVGITLSTLPGTGDVSIDGVSLDDIDAFRTECLSGGEVSCGWNTLHTHLINHDISRFWWLLTESERRAIAETAIKNTVFYQIMFKGIGEPNCAGAENFTLMSNPCGANSIIRYLKFATDENTNVDACYYKRDLLATEHCFKPDVTYELPVNAVELTHGDSIHSMCGIHVKDGTDSLNNWIVFQYNECDIKPGTAQMPYGSSVKIISPTTVTCSSFGYNTPLTEFQI